MSWTLNSVALSTYGITAGQIPGGNIALQGCFDLPSRSGKCFHDWGDEDGIQPYVASGEIYFAGRDLIFHGLIQGTNSAINVYLTALYAAINAFTDLVTFSTPYGDFSAQVKSVKTEFLRGACKIIMTFREPVVTLSGGELPATGDNAYTIDSIPMASFGLYLSKTQLPHALPELKEQMFTEYGSEGYQIVKRNHNILELNGYVMADSLAAFQVKIKALYLLFSSASTRTVVLNREITAVCFAAEGFAVNNVHLHSGKMIASFKAKLLCESVESPIADADGNIYTYVTIGTQQWLVENLHTTKYIDGTVIPNLPVIADWMAEDGTLGHDGAYCWYDNDQATYEDPYGALYNWYAVNNAHGLAPVGWRVPSYDNYLQLINFLGGFDLAGGILKEVGLLHWLTPNTGAVDTFGFKAVGGGQRATIPFDEGIFHDIKVQCTLWTTNEDGVLYGIDGQMNYNDDNFGSFGGGNKNSGRSVRCMRDI